MNRTIGNVLLTLLVLTLIGVGAVLAVRSFDIPNIGEINRSEGEVQP